MPRIKNLDKVSISLKEFILTPAKTSVWSVPSVIYLVLSIFLVFIFWWATTRDQVDGTGKIEDKNLLTVIFSGYLLFGFILVLFFSHHSKPLYSWIAVLTIMSPVIALTFWLTYHIYHQTSSKDKKD